MSGIISDSLHQEVVRVAKESLLPTENEKTSFRRVTPQKMTSVTKNVWENLADQFGNKSANLMKLDRVLHILNDKQLLNVKVHVPEFHAISNEDMLSLINKELEKKGTSMEALWNRFNEAQGEEKGHLTEEARSVLKEMNQLISEAFDNGNALSDDVRSWMDEHKNVLLMVRSTGKEDSEDVANPGGNKSVAAVEPEGGAVIDAMKTVVLSYIQPKSLEQRLLRGDDLSSPPFLPVLLQEMVNERSHGVIEKVTSGVMFARESEGKTQNTTHIQCAPGHAELIVNGQGGFDSFHCHEQDVYSVIGVKDVRKATLEDGKTLKTIENSKELKYSPSLTRDAVQNLHQVAQVIRDVWGTDVDIEFSVTPHGIEIYQVRPTSSTAEHIPSYVQNLKEHLVFKGITIGAAGGAVREIRSKDEVIVAPTLKQALPKFLALKDKSKIKAILVHAWAPINSHEAQMFRSVEIPTLSCPKTSEIQKILDGPNPHLWVDTQQGSVVNAENPVIQEGWISHPIPAIASMLTWQDWETLEGAWNLFLEKYTQLTPEEKEIHSLKDLQDALEQAKFGNREQMETALSKLVFYSQKQVLRAHQAGDDEAVKQYMGIFQGVLSSANSILEIVKQSGEESKTSLTRLYAANFLEAALFQTPSTDFVDADSLVSSLYTGKEEAKLAERLADLGQIRAEDQPYYIQFLKVGVLACSPEVRQNWESFLENMTAYPEKTQELAQLLHELQKTGLLFQWMNASFPSLWKASENNASIALNVARRQIFVSQDVLGWVAKTQQSLLNYQRNIDKLSRPEQFTKQFAVLKNEIATNISSQEIKSLFENSNRIGKILILNSIRSSVEVFDQSIKAMKYSPLYQDKKLQAARLGDMLEQYMVLVEDLYGMTSQDMKKALNGNAEQKIDNVIPRTQTLLQTKRTELASESVASSDAEKELFPSRSFSVSAARLGSGTVFERHLPQTLEDIFTLIHQDSLALLSILGAEYGLVINQLPSPVKKLAVPISQMPIPSSIKNQDAFPQYMSTDFSHPHVLTSFSIPLRNHSASLVIDFDSSTNKTKINFNMFGHNMGHRMDFAALYASLGAQVSQMEFSSTGFPKYDPLKMSLEMEWEVDSGEVTSAQMEKLLPFISLMVGLTLPEEAQKTPGLKEFKFEKSVKALQTNLKQIDKEGAAVFAWPEELFALVPFFSHAHALEQYKAGKDVPMDIALRAVKDITAQPNMPEVNPTDAQLIYTDGALLTKLIDALLEQRKTESNRAAAEEALVALAKWKPLTLYTVGGMMKDASKVLQFLQETGKSEEIKIFSENFVETAIAMSEKEGTQWRVPLQLYMMGALTFLKQNINYRNDQLGHPFLMPKLALAQSKLFQDLITFKLKDNIDSKVVVGYLKEVSSNKEVLEEIKDYNTALFIFSVLRKEFPNDQSIKNRAEDYIQSVLRKFSDKGRIKELAKKLLDIDIVDRYTGNLSI